MTRIWARMAAIVVIGVFASYGVAAVTVGQLPDPPEASAAPTATVVSLDSDQLYVFPQSEQDAMHSCVQRERTAREIPGDVAGYTAWYEANRGLAVGDNWDRAYEQCRTRSYTTSLFDFAHLVQVR
jgi:hypothetical protein